MIDFKYRPDVDGLRAVAVTLVILFHAGLGFTGGFIGVDVFFVISGFLITGLILKEQDAGKFSLANFWVRRIRRIIPAATVMVVALLIAGFFLLLPSDYDDLGGSTIAQQLMLSNVYFWQNTGYFDGPSDLKPLLHTWSLAVEEQFYLGYPFLLMFLHRFGKKATFATLATFCLGSLALSEYGVHHHPSATFFLLPTRAWELLVGGLICFLPKPSKVPSWALSGASWISLAAILGVGWAYTSATPFPGLTATVPCVATAVLIYSNTIRLSLPAVVLATKPFVFIGLISYSLYLWHWPLLALARGAINIDLSPLQSILAVVACIGLAVVSWQLVEKPFRHGQSVRKNEIIFKSALISFALVIVTSVFIARSNGFVNRFPVSMQELARKTKAASVITPLIDAVKSGDLPELGQERASRVPPSFVVWGDSHAKVLSTEFDEIAMKNGLSGVIATRVGTPPILSIWKPKWRNWGDRTEWNKAVFEYILTNKIKHVILVFRWDSCLNQSKSTHEHLVALEGWQSTSPDSAELALRRGLKQTITALESNGSTVWVIKQVPLQRVEPQKEILRELWYRNKMPSGVSVLEHEANQRRARRITDGVKNSTQMREIDLAPAFFNQEGFSKLGDRGGSYYVDHDHVSAHGAGKICSPILKDILEEIRLSSSQ